MEAAAQTAAETSPTADQLVEWIQALETGPAPDARAALREWFDEAWLELVASEQLGPETEGATSLWLYSARLLSDGLEGPERVALLQRARAVGDRTDQVDRNAAIHGALADALLDVGSLDEAREVIESADPRLRTSWVYFPAIALERIRLARLQGRWEEGLDAAAELIERGLLMDQAIDSMRNASDAQRQVALLHRRIRALALGQRARLELELGRLDRAVTSALEELELAEQVEDRSAELDARLALADAAYLRDDPAETLAIVEELEAEGLGDASSPALAHLTGMALGGLALKGRESPAKAVQRLERALGGPGLDQLAAFDAEWMLSELALSEGDVERAATHLADARGRFDSWSQPDDAIGTRELRLLANEAQLACLASAGPERLSEIERALEGGLQVLLDSWRRTDAEAGGVGFLESEDRRALLGELIRVRQTLHGEAGLERCVADLLAAWTMGSAARRAGLTAGDLEDVRTGLLGAGAGLMIYVPTGPVTHALAVDAERITARVLPGQYALAESIDGFQRLAAERDPPREAREARRERARALTGAGSALAEALLPRELASLAAGWTSIGVVGLESLRGITLETLCDREGRTLGCALPLYTIPSIPLALADARRRAEEPVSYERDLALLAFLEPDGAALERFPGLARVPAEELELEAVAAAYDRDRRAILRSPPPVAADLRQALDSAAVVQVLAHGVFDPFRERGAGLLLAPNTADPGESGDGFVWSEDLARLGQQPRGLVLLTSCGTSIGPRRLGDDEPTDLATTLLERGAAAVVTTREKLELSLADQLSRALHRNLARGDGPAEALRSARAAVAGRDVLRGFEVSRVRLLGRDLNPLPAPSPRGSGIGYAAAAALLTAGAVSLIRRRAR